MYVEYGSSGRMPNYKNSDIAQLAHQLTLSPRRQRLSQIAGAEHLLELVQEDKTYPYDFVCFHLTGYRPLRPSGKATFKGRSLISDLVRLVEHLSQSASIPLSAVSEPLHTQEELSKRLSVSLKTIFRWRQRGLAGWRVLDENRVGRLVFTEKSLQRFVATHRELIVRGGAFKQLDEDERRQIIQQAGEMVAAQRLKLQEVARLIAARTGRAVETIRYTLRRYDQQNPDVAIFGPGERPRVPEHYVAIFQGYRQGRSLADLSQQYGLTTRQANRICHEMRAYEFQNRKLNFVYHPDFDMPGAPKRIMDAPEVIEPESNIKNRVRPPQDAPAYLKALYDVPLLSREQEYDLFRRYNFCKYVAHTLIQKLEPAQVRSSQLTEIESFLSRANDLQNRLIQANLRLVVSIAGKHWRRGGNMFELISDGNMSLMRAIERFDFSRGFKFSTYATWAIMKNYARTLPDERTHQSQFVTGQDELLQAFPERFAGTVGAPAVEAEGLRGAVCAGLKHLDARERQILISHFGLGPSESPSTLEQLGERFGITKERIRQIEKRALQKLKNILPGSLAEYVHPVG